MKDNFDQKERPDINLSELDGKLGDILVKSKKIAPGQIREIIEFQNETGMLFGKAAIKLGLATKKDIDSAISVQFSYPYITNGNININNHIPNTLSKELIAACNPFCQQAEAIRSIRTELLRQGDKKGLKTISILSAGSGEGRTFLAANLSVAFAQMGASTLLIDLNFRGPRIHELFGKDNSSGISSLIINRATWKQAIKPTPFSSLNIMTSGPIPPNPLEILERRQVQQILKELQETFYVVIVDTPCLLQSTDALVIASMTEGSVLVASEGKTKRADFSHITNKLSSLRTRILGSVLNRHS
ncbi:MAG: polysaccharide biosynthesis tyrosine autokinase [Nitrospinota bacterium]